MASDKRRSDSRCKLDRLDLRRLAAAICESIPDMVTSGRVAFTFSSFHGFLKSGFPVGTLEPLLRAFGVSAHQVQIEVAGVLEDLTHEVHIHRRTEAHVTCVGENFGLPNPSGAYAFLNYRWTPLNPGDTLEIPPGVEHGFTVDPGGCLYFLSVQSPPIVSESGEEDYIIQPFTRWTRVPQVV
jgi:hypothetical protein